MIGTQAFRRFRAYPQKWKPTPSTWVEKTGLPTKCPTRVTYSDLVLKRGLIIPASPIADWCFKHLKGGLNEKIEPKTITVTLLDANVKHQKPIMTWVFVNAYPIGWEVEGLNAQQNGFAIESLTMTYNYFWKLDEEEGKKFPFVEEKKN
jgi:phage tail-like protein